MTDRKNPEYLCDNEVDGASGGYKLDMTDVIISSYQVSGTAVEKPTRDGAFSIDYGVVARKDIRRG